MSSPKRGTNSLGTGKNFQLIRSLAKMPEDRLDRLEAIAEKILEGLAETKQRTDSNAKSIQALSDALARDRDARSSEKEEKAREQAQLYQYLGRIAAAQSGFYEVQADYYHQLAALQERQTKIEEKQSQMREEILAILNRFTLLNAPEQA